MERARKRAAETKLKVLFYYLPRGPEKNHNPPTPVSRVRIIGDMDEPGSN
jgi:hypothetical protein